ncbi:MAG: Asp-tRNA(Asn)/Glu-tRNA(Gln) amidotransferase subunit GatC [Phycisphaeraceae bacterium]
MMDKTPNQPQRITEQQVRHVAKLSRLRLTDDQIHQFTDQLADVLDYVAKLNELDVANVEPMAHAMDLLNVLREDAEKQSLSVDEALANAPDASPPFFKVPKVLGDASGA